MSILSVGKVLLDKYPYLTKKAALIYNTINANKIKLKGINNKIKNSTCFFKKANITVLGENNIIDVGYKSVINNCSIYIRGNNNKVTIGEKVFLKDTQIYIEDNNNEVIIGERTTIFGKTHLACIEGTNIIIGSDCMFSTDVVFRTGDSHSIIDEQGKRVNNSKNIIIGNHVWFGNKVIITKGVRIQANSIVGTGSVVTRQFDREGVVLAGNPAKVIKENINWLRERI